MLLKKHHINIWVRIAGITINCMVVAYFAVVHPDWLILTNLLVVLIVQVYLLGRSQNAIARELELFFDTLKSFDSSSRFANRLQTKGYSDMYQKFDEIFDSIQAIKLENQHQSQYLATLVEHVNIGIIVVDDSGAITLANSSAKKLLGISSLKSLASIQSVDQGLANTIKTIEPHGHEVYSLFNSGAQMALSVRASHIRFNSGEVKIVSLQNIKHEMDESEMEGWQKLIRVLTHELMNSAGPISSTISTLLDLLSENSNLPNGQATFTPDVIDDLNQGLRIVEERSKGMVDFVTRFRNLTLIPQPKFAEVNIRSVFESIGVLLKDELKDSCVELTTIVSDSSITACADKGMLQQIIINLVKNAIKAVQSSSAPKVKMSAWKDNSNSIFIEIKDNGVGIPPELHSKIFVPFFTTRKNGTGIGLSLSRQLANVQGGALTLSKSIAGETVFTLWLKSI